jgi:large subunit ribosomal protein L22
MQFIAEQKNTRQSPRKVRLVADTVRKMPLEQALKQLAVMEKRASLVVTKVLRQAIANAWHNHHVPFTDLSLKNITVNAGPVYKRWQAVSRGRAHSIYKRTSHIMVVLETTADMKPTVTKPTAKTERKTAQKSVSNKTKKVKK